MFVLELLELDEDIDDIFQRSQVKIIIAHNKDKEEQLSTFVPRNLLLDDSEYNYKDRKEIITSVATVNHDTVENDDDSDGDANKDESDIPRPYSEHAAKCFTNRGC